MAKKTKTTTKPHIKKLKRKTKQPVVATKTKLDSGPKLLLTSLRHLWAHKKLFGAILLIYFLLSFVFVSGLTLNFSLRETQIALDEAQYSSDSAVGRAAESFGILLANASSATDEASSLYQMFLLVLISLVVIWSLRTTFEYRETSPTVKVAFYQSTYALVPYLLVGGIILLQLLPALLGLSIYGVVVSNNIAVGVIEQLGWLVLTIFMCSVSIYFISTSLFASYIVTLPNMQPLSALRSAKKLVRFRRLLVIRKMLFLPFVLLVFLAAIIMPIILSAPHIAEAFFMIISLALVLVAHSYFYVLYRELL